MVAYHSMDTYLHMDLHVDLRRVQICIRSRRSCHFRIVAVRRQQHAVVVAPYLVRSFILHKNFAWEAIVSRPSSLPDITRARGGGRARRGRASRSTVHEFVVGGYNPCQSSCLPISTSAAYIMRWAVCEELPVSLP